MYAGPLARLTLLVSFAAVSCIAGCRESTGTPGADTPGPDAPLTEPYPPARWRLARSEELGQVVLWASHILIRHRAVPPGVVSFNLGDWTPAPPAPERTREEAFEIARRIADQLRGEPSQFAEIARQFSEDVVTREQGGSLGGVCASELYRRHAGVLDVLAALRPGELSRVVETAYGFHIFARRAPPPEETLSGSRIIIAYDEAPWLHAFLARRAIPPRRRAEALTLAASVYARVRAGESFEQLVEQFSDHQEALRKGDFGEWSTRQCSPYPREVEVLQKLALKETAAPIDSTFGVQIIKRMPNRARESFSMTTVQQRYDYMQPPDAAASRESVRANLERMAADVLRAPSLFEKLQATSCCALIDQWQEGQGPADAERALSLIQTDQIAPWPVDIGGAYAIIKRVAVSVKAAPPYRFELPSPQAVDVFDLARRGLVNHELPAVAERVVSSLELEGDLKEQLVSLHTAQARVADEIEGDRIRHFEEFLERIKAVLTGPRYRDYLTLLEHYFSELLLAPLSTTRPR